MKTTLLALAFVVATMPSVAVAKGGSGTSEGTAFCLVWVNGNLKYRPCKF